MWESSFYRSIFAEGQAHASRRAAIELLRLNMDINLIAKATELSIETIQTLKKEI